jgi:hypothetical protein
MQRTQAPVVNFWEERKERRKEERKKEGRTEKGGLLHGMGRQHFSSSSAIFKVQT